MNASAPQAAGSTSCCLQPQHNAHAAVQVPVMTTTAPLLTHTTDGATDFGRARQASVTETACETVSQADASFGSPCNQCRHPIAARSRSTASTVLTTPTCVSSRQPLKTVERTMGLLATASEGVNLGNGLPSCTCNVHAQQRAPCFASQNKPQQLTHMLSPTAA